MVRSFSADERLSLEILRDSNKSEWCPNLKRDGEGLPYCGINMGDEQVIREERRRFCDIYSLQLWCTDKERYERCLVYKEGFVD